MRNKGLQQKLRSVGSKECIFVAVINSNYQALLGSAIGNT